MTTREDLEYHITFPALSAMGGGPSTTSSSDDSGIAADGSVRSARRPQEDQQSSDSDEFTDDVVQPTASRDCVKLEPVVVLLGWYACEDRHLSKYSKLYEDMGCITMRFIPRPDLFLYQPDNMRAIASKLVELVVEFKLEAHPILIHMFSNGGCYVYRHICELLNGDADESQPLAATAAATSSSSTPPPTPSQSSPVKLHVRGVVFDSGPAINSPLNFFRAIRDTTRGTAVYRWMRGGFLMLVVVVAFIVEYLMGFVWPDVRNRSAPLAMWACLTRDPLRCPQLFLYSKADIICDHKSIKNFIDERRKCGVPVSEVCWDDSPHVKHLLVHRDEYTKHVTRFVRTCLHDDDDDDDDDDEDVVVVGRSATPSDKHHVAIPMEVNAVQYSSSRGSLV